jgi:hypothetical protein
VILLGEKCMDREMKRKCAIRAAVFFALTIFVVGLAAPSVSATTTKYYYPPYGDGGGWIMGQQTSGVGHVSIYVSPYASSSGGVAKEFTSTIAGPGYGLAYISNREAFYGTTFVAPISGTYTITYAWQMWCYATVTAYGSYYSAGTAWAKILVKGNLIQYTSPYGYVTSDKSVTVWDKKVVGLIMSGSSAICHKDGTYYYVTFSVSLKAGYTYCFRTWIDTEQKTGGLVGAQGLSYINMANTDIFGSGNYAALKYIKLVY